MPGVAALDGAPLCARQLYVLLMALPVELRSLAPGSRQARAALAELVAAHPLTVMPSRADTRLGYAWLRARGVIL